MRSKPLTTPSMIALGAFLMISWAILTPTASAQTFEGINTIQAIDFATTTTADLNIVRFNAPTCSITNTTAHELYFWATTTQSWERLGIYSNPSTCYNDNGTQKHWIAPWTVPEGANIYTGNINGVPDTRIYLLTFGGDPSLTSTSTYDQYDHGIVWQYTKSTNNFSTVTVPNYTPTSTAPTPQANQYINILSPEYGSTTDNDVVITVSFKTPFSFDFRPTTTRTVVIKDAVTLTEEKRYQNTLEANGGENTTVNYTANLTDGSKLVYAYYATENGAIYSETAETFFNVNVNSYQTATGLVSPNAVPTETQNNCSTFDIGCQFQKALMFLFYPSDAILQKFSNLWQNISTKKPFGYITVTIQQLTALDTNSAHAFDLGEVPFQEAIFDPFKLALGSILWALYAIFFYQRRLKHFDV